MCWESHVLPHSLHLEATLKHAILGAGIDSSMGETMLSMHTVLRSILSSQYNTIN